MRSRRRVQPREVLRKLRVGEVLSKERAPLVRVTTSVDDLATLFANDRTPAAVVVDGQQLAGIVLRDDVVGVARWHPEPWPRAPYRRRAGHRSQRAPTPTAAALLRPAPVTITEEMSVGDSIAMMLISKVPLAVVLSASMRPLGLLTLREATRQVVMAADAPSATTLPR